MEQLRRRNLRLERDLYDTLQALEEETFSASSPSSSRADSLPSSPRGVPKANALASKTMQDLVVCTSRPVSASAPEAVDTPPVALCGVVASLAAGEPHAGVFKEFNEVGVASRRSAPRAPSEVVRPTAAPRPPVLQARPPIEGCGSPKASNSSASCPSLPLGSPTLSESGASVLRRLDQALHAHDRHGGSRVEFELGTPGLSEEEDGADDVARPEGDGVLVLPS